MCKYNISYITTDMHHSQHNPYERRIQFYKKVIKIILDLTGDTIYVLLCALLIWIGISNFLDKHSRGHRYSH